MRDGVAYDHGLEHPKPRRRRRVDLLIVAVRPGAAHHAVDRLTFTFQGQQAGLGPRAFGVVLAVIKYLLTMLGHEVLVPDRLIMHYESINGKRLD